MVGGLLSSQLSMSGKEIGSIVNFQQAVSVPMAGDARRRERCDVSFRMTNWPSSFIQGVVGKDAEIAVDPATSQLRAPPGVC